MAQTLQDGETAVHAGDADHPVAHVLGLIRRIFSTRSDAVDGPTELRGLAVDPSPDIGTADTLRSRANAALERHVQDREAEDDRAVLDDRRRVKILLQTQLEQGMWNEILTRIRSAAERGETEFMLLRFPSDLCIDGGRKVRIRETGWEDTLQGEARDLARRYAAELRPRALRLDARTLDYRDDLPGDIGLFVDWRS